jgi:hypothetical protein
MKMKKITLGCSMLAAAAMFLSSCNKKTNPEPQQDTEVQSSVDAIYASQTVADLDIIAGFMGENLLNTSYFQQAPGSTGTIIPSRDTAQQILTVIYTNSVTCRDGKKRNGTIALSYSATPGNVLKYMRKPGFICDVTLNNYYVDGWKVTNVTPLHIVNTSPNPVGSANLTWAISGTIGMKNMATGDSMSWNGKLTKELTNTSTSVVVNPSGLNSINWVPTYTTNGAVISPTGAKLAYTGTVTGVTKTSNAYTFIIDQYNETQPLVIDFTCAPDKVLGVYTTTTTPVVAIPVYEERHPFISGYASFTTSAEPTEARKIDFSMNGSAACDDKATVVIKGIQYAIDLKK